MFGSLSLVPSFQAALIVGQLWGFSGVSAMNSGEARGSLR
jgi:hypothetical protein